MNLKRHLSLLELIILLFTISPVYATTLGNELVANSKQGTVYNLDDLSVSVTKCSLKKIDGLYRIFVQISFKNNSTKALYLKDKIEISAYQGDTLLEEVNHDIKGINTHEKVSPGETGSYANGFTLIDPKETIKICLDRSSNKNEQNHDRIYSLSLKNKKIAQNEVDDPNNWLNDEDETKETTQKNAHDTTGNSILFRNIKWFEKCATVKKQCESVEGFRPSWYNPVDERARIDGWYHQWKYMYSDDNVINGGVILQYDDVSVAGYTADLSLSFLYPIVNHSIFYDTDSSRFYKAKYTIEDLEDIENAYNDLKKKLSTLYGSPEPKSYYNTLEKKDDPKGCMWTGADGSVVWLGIYYNSISEKYDELNLVYAAPQVEKMLLALDAQMKKETSAQEELKRQENTSNYDGL